MKTRAHTCSDIRMDAMRKEATARVCAEPWRFRPKNSGSASAPMTSLLSALINTAAWRRVLGRAHGRDDPCRGNRAGVKSQIERWSQVAKAAGIKDE